MSPMVQRASAAAWSDDASPRLRCRAAAGAGAARRAGTTLAGAGSTLRLRPEQALLSSQGPAESARSDEAGTKAKHSSPTQAGPELALGHAEGV